MKRAVALFVLVVLLTACAVAQALNVGDRGEDVQRAQERLAELGYLTESADGIYGKKTQTAVGLFQQNNNLDVTGEIDDATDAALFSESPVRNEALLAQLRLIELGFLEGEADGIIGSMTRQAISDFQGVNDLAETGELDDATLEALYSESARRNRTGEARTALKNMGYLQDADADAEEYLTALHLFQRLHGVAESDVIDDATIAAFEGVQVIYTTLKDESEGDDVVRLQQRLIELGFLEGEADGKYGKLTEAAVLTYQKHLNAQGESTVSMTGNASPLTQEFLFSEYASTYMRDVQLGDEDSEVRRVECRLTSLGYFDVPTDTLFDDYTQKAVIAFQNAQGITASGIVDRETMDALYAADAPVAEHYVEHDIALGDSGLAVLDVQKTLIRYGFYAYWPDGVFADDLSEAIERFHDYLEYCDNADAELFAEDAALSADAQALLKTGDWSMIDGALAHGSDKQQVRRMQRRLCSLYYLSQSGIDGKYGKSTTKAITAFQENNGLEATGTADEETLRVLYSEDPAGGGTEYLLRVDISEQRVHVYQQDESNHYVELGEFICSTGKGDSTPVGVFTNTRPMNVWHYFEDFDCWAQYAYQISGNILFHSVLYNSNNSSSLRTGSLYALGHKASHGCVRLKVEDAKWIYENCAKGTVVVICR